MVEPSAVNHVANDTSDTSPALDNGLAIDARSHDLTTPLTNQSPSNKHSATGSLVSEPSQPPIPYSVFSPSQKWAVVILAACAGLFSPLGANIYFPAIPTLSHAFHKSVQDIK